MRQGRQRTGRGQTSVVGLALVIAIVLIGITTVVVFGGMALDDLQHSAQLSQAEAALTQVDSTGARVALGSSDVQTVSLGNAGQTGQVAARATGRMVIETEDGTEYVNQTLGTVTYERGGDVVAYQGGGVWRGTGNESRMVSPPEFHYRDETLTLPAVVVNPTETGTGDRLTLEDNGSRVGLGPGTVDSQVLTVRVTSDYYMGWARYFRTRIDGVTVHVDHQNETVEADLVRLDLDGDFDTGLVASGDVNVDTSGTVDTTIAADGGVSDKHGAITCSAGGGADCYGRRGYPDWMALDEAIGRAVAHSAANDPDAGIDGSTTLGAGTYYSDGFLLDGETLTLDVSSGNVTLFVDGNVGLKNGQIEVVGGAGTNHTARIYTTGDFAMVNGLSEVSVQSGDASRFQLYGTSEMQFAMGQSKGFTGAVYAPRDTSAPGSNDAVAEYGLVSATASCPSDVDVCLGQGSGDVKGAIVGGPASIEQATSFEYGESLRTVEPAFPANATLPPPITYLHISVNRIDVAGAQWAEGTVPLPVPRVVATLSVSEQGSDAYRLDASGTAASDLVDEYRWDVDDDGTIDATTTDPALVVHCQSAGGPLDCSSPPANASVTVVDTGGGQQDAAVEAYPSPDGGGGGDHPPSVDTFTVTDDSRCTGGASCNGHDEATFDIAWTVTDPDHDVAQVTVEVLHSGHVVRQYSGQGATETYTQDGRYGDQYAVRVEATDGNGNSVCETITDSAANDDDSDQTGPAAC
ncbi:MAG: hypothetical protein ABEJ23_08080 [Haloarculaceae archaeon]